MKKFYVLLLVSIFVLSACSSSDSSNENASNTSSPSVSNSGNDTVKDGKTSCGDPLLDASSIHQVEIETTEGNFTIELDVKNAPISTAHFAGLVSQGFYDGLIFHRVVPGFVIQGGDPDGNGTGSSDCKVISEGPPGAYQQGYVAWAKTGAEQAGTAGSQFFIMTDSAALPTEYGYAGKVVQGIDVVQKIVQVPRDSFDKPLKDVTMTKLTLKS